MTKIRRTLTNNDGEKIVCYVYDKLAICNTDDGWRCLHVPTMMEVDGANNFATKAKAMAYIDAIKEHFDFNVKTKEEFDEKHDPEEYANILQEILK